MCSQRNKNTSTVLMLRDARARSNVPNSSGRAGTSKKTSETDSTHDFASRKLFGDFLVIRIFVTALPRGGVIPAHVGVTLRWVNVSNKGTRSIIDVK